MPLFECEITPDFIRGKTKTYRQMSKVVGCNSSNKLKRITLVEKQLKKGRAFAEIISGYKGNS